MFIRSQQYSLADALADGSIGGGARGASAVDASTPSSTQRPSFSSK